MVDGKWSIGIKITIIGMATALMTSAIGFTYNYGKRDTAIVANKAELINLRDEVKVLSTTVNSINRELGEVHTLVKTLIK